MSKLKNKYILLKSRFFYILSKPFDFVLNVTRNRKFEINLIQLLQNKNGEKMYSIHKKNNEEMETRRQFINVEFDHQEKVRQNEKEEQK